MQTPTPDHLKGCAIAALSLAVFGSAWFAFWLAATQRLGPATGAILSLGLLALLLTGSWVLRQARQLPPAAPNRANAAKRRREWRVFGAVDAAQWASIFFAGWLLPRLGLAAYLTPLVVGMVGLHFFPLARLFHYHGYYFMGGALVVWPVGCLLVLPQPEWPASVALAAGSILWLSIGYLLWPAVQRLRNAQAVNRAR